MTETIINLVNFLKSNPIFIALAGSLSLGSIVTAIFFIIKWSIDKIKFFCIQTLTIEDYQEFFTIFNEWLTTQSEDIFSRDYTTYNGSNHRPIKRHSDDDLSIIKLVPGFGFHIFFYDKKIFFLYRHKLENKGNSNFEKIELVTFSFKRNAFTKLIKDAVEGTTKLDKVKYYTTKWGTDWKNTFNKNKRSIDSIFLNKNDKEKLITDIKNFHTLKDFYKKKFIPYKRNYLFYGAPGCGKSSFINAIASETDLPIYILNFNTLENGERSLIDVITELNFPCILLIEDIDGANIKINRDSDPSENENNKITMSTLLNILDGTYCTEERITIITTNFPEKLDNALLRSGRIDYHFEFKKLNTEVSLEMIKHFYEIEDGNLYLDKIKEMELEISGAELENLLMKNDISVISEKLEKFNTKKEIDDCEFSY